MNQDQLKQLLLTSDGRINRQKWWIGTLAIIVISIVAAILIAIISFGNGFISGALRVILNLVMLYPIYCIGIKRRHDRDNDGKDLIAFMVVSFVANLLGAVGFEGILMAVVELGAFAFAIYMLVQLGVLEGTDGPNSYGPDPLKS